jgi:hypothetical protein
MRLDLQRIVGDFKESPASLRLRFGQVTASAVGSVTVTVAGSSTAVAGVSYLSSYTPVVNDTVVLLTDGIDLLVLGKMA